MTDKNKLRVRSVMLSDYHWGLLESRAKEETENNGITKTSCADIIRHAIVSLLVKNKPSNQDG